MRKLFYILAAALLVISSCKSSSQVNTSKEVIIDPITASPYEFKYNPIFILPDSLGGGKYKGIAVLDGKFMDSLQIGNIRITKLVLLTETRDTIINYYFGKDSLSLKGIYPPYISAYLPFFEDFIKTVVIKKREGVSAKNMDRITLMLRLK